MTASVIFTGNAKASKNCTTSSATQSGETPSGPKTTKRKAELQKSTTLTLDGVPSIDAQLTWLQNLQWVLLKTQKGDEVALP